MLFRPQMDADDRAYYLKRTLQEQEAARNASCPEARERHEELANAYRHRCQPSGSACGPLALQNSEAVDYAA